MEARRTAGTVLDHALAPLAPALLARHGRRARAVGIDAVTVVLSFDCDTERDIEVAPAVSSQLTAMGVRAVWAVPGELLERGADTYRSIAATGAELVNHGYREHTAIDASGAYINTYVYRDLDDAERDVRRGHDAHLEVLGRAPVGFRAPHFGLFKRRRQLGRLYEVLGSLGYRYSSSTLPSRGLVRGPVYGVGPGLVELPVSGRRSSPRRVLDTWSFRHAPGRTVDADDYLAEVRSLVSFYVERRQPALLNLYADPSQVADWPEWFVLVGELAPLTAASFVDLLDGIQ